MGEKASGTNAERTADAADGRGPRTVQISIFQSTGCPTGPDQSSVCSQWCRYLYSPSTKLSRSCSCWPKYCWNWGKPFHFLPACHHSSQHHCNRSGYHNTCRLLFHVLQPLPDALHICESLCTYVAGYQRPRAADSSYILHSPAADQPTESALFCAIDEFRYHLTYPHRCSCFCH